jgi:thiol-disulfide isomerase/thioredoxin
MKKFWLIFLLLPVWLAAQDLSQLRLKDADGKTFIMKEHLENDATIILFWATWCIPCREEFPVIDQLQKKYPDKKIKVITISQDSPRSLAKVKTFAKAQKFDFTYLTDPNGEISSKLLVNSIPHSLLVDRQGKVFYTHTGYRKGDELDLEKKMQTYWQAKGTPE